MPVPSIERTKLSDCFDETLFLIESFSVNAPDGRCTVVGGPAVVPATATPVSTDMASISSPAVFTRAAMFLLSRSGQTAEQDARTVPETDSSDAKRARKTKSSLP